MNNQKAEKILIKACLDGDIRAQRSFYDRFAPKMLGVCRRFVKSREAAEDLLQDGFFKVFCDLHQFKGKGSLEGWVRQVIVNTALQEVRKKKLALQSDIKVEDVAIPDKSHEQIWQKFEIEELLKMLHNIPEGCRLIFNLYVMADYSHREIAEQLSISIGTSKSQLAKARRLLKKQMQKAKILI